MMNILQLLYNDIWYHINYLKYTNIIPAQLFRYLLFYMKAGTTNIIIYDITDLSL